MQYLLRTCADALIYIHVHVLFIHMFIVFDLRGFAKSFSASSAAMEPAHCVIVPLKPASVGGI